MRQNMVRAHITYKPLYSAYLYARGIFEDREFIKTRTALNCAYLFYWRESCHPWAHIECRIQWTCAVVRFCPC